MNTLNGVWLDKLIKIIQDNFFLIHRVSRHNKGYTQNCK